MALEGEIGPQGSRPCQGAVAVEVTLPAFRFLLVGLYLRPSIGLVGENLDRLGELGAWLSLLHTPWLVVGDWNAPPAALASTGWLERTTR